MTRPHAQHEILHALHAKAHARSRLPIFSFASHVFVAYVQGDVGTTIQVGAAEVGKPMQARPAEASTSSRGDKYMIYKYKIYLFT